MCNFLVLRKVSFLAKFGFLAKFPFLTKFPVLTKSWVLTKISVFGQISSFHQILSKIEKLRPIALLSFIYLAYNAPHEPTMAPQRLIDEMAKLHPNTEFSRLEYLATIYHMDLRIKNIVNEAKKFKRETIFIFQSDNGGATQKFRGKRVEEMRACNFPYKGRFYQKI